MTPGAHRRPARPPGWLGPRLGGWTIRQTSNRRAALAALGVVLLLALLSPLLLLTSWVPGSPAHLQDDPTVAALLALRNPGGPAGPTPAGVHLSTLADGTLKATGRGQDGICYQVLVPANPAQAPSGVTTAPAGDCPTP